MGHWVGCHSHKTGHSKRSRTCHIGSPEIIAAYIDRSYVVGFLFSRHRIILNRLDLITKTR